MKYLDVFSLPLKGTHLIEASAGSGKTYTLCTLYLRHIIEKLRNPSEILMVTFTRASTNDLAQKITQRLEDIKYRLSFPEKLDEEWKSYLHTLNISTELAKQQVEKAQREFNQASIYTIHGFCNMLIRQYPQEIGYFGSYEVLEEDDSKYSEKIIIKHWREQVLNNPTSEEKQFLKKAIESQINIHYFTHLIHLWLQRSYCTFTPCSIPPFSQWYEHTVDIFQKLKAVWPEEQGILEELTPQLKQNIYKKEKVKKGLQFLKSYLGQGKLPNVFPEEIILFGSNKIEKGKKKNSPSIELTMGCYIDQLDQNYKELERYLLQFYKKKLIKVNNDYWQYRLKKRKLFYNDLLHIVYQTLTQPRRNISWIKSLVEQFPVVMVDEFQDTDPTQFKIFQTIYGQNQHTHWVMVGDPKQAIYNFRGGDIDTYFNVRDHLISPQDHYLLKYNYRSHPNIIEGINRFFGHKRSFCTEQISYYHVSSIFTKKTTDIFPPAFSPRFAVLQVKSDKKDKKHSRYKYLASAAATLLQKWLDPKINVQFSKERLCPSDIAIIVSTREQASFIASTCQEKRIPVTIFTQQNIFKIKQAEELILILEAINNPFSIAKIATALSTQWFLPLGYQNKEINILKWTTIFHRAYLVSQGDSPIAAIKWLLNQTKSLLNFVKNRQSTECINRIYQLLDELSYQYITKKISLDQLIDELKESYYHSSKKTVYWQDNQNARGVSIATIHYCKGLEFNVVICPFIDEMGSYFPNKPTLIPVDSKEEKQNIVLYMPSLFQPHKNQMKHHYLQKEREENMRLTYVALTRAKEACYILHLISDQEKGNGKSKASESKKKLVSPLSHLLGGLIENSVDKPCSLVYDFQGYIDGLGESEKINTLHTTETTLATFPLGVAKRRHLSTYQLSSYSRISSMLFQKNNYHHLSTVDPSSCLFVGKQAGSCIHKILEQMDFTIPFHKQIHLIDNILPIYGFDNRHKEEAFRLIKPLYHSLFNNGADSFSLPMIASIHQQREMDFLFFCQDIPWLSRIFSTYPVSNSAYSITPQKGGPFLIRGFIDKFLQFNKRFYIVDYKTDMLGNGQLGQYSNTKIKAHIQNQYYDIQFHFYTLAAHLHLKMRLKESYKYYYFGGMFYVFLRGLASYKVASLVPQESIVFLPSSPELISSLEKKYHLCEYRL